MTIVSTPSQAPGAPEVSRGALLEVGIAGPQDVAGVQEGGADRLVLATPGPEGGLSPTPQLVQSTCAATDLPVRVVLRLNDGFSTTGGELTRLVGLATDFLDSGAEGLVMGFLDRDLEIDTEVCAAVLERLPGVRWTFSRAIDQGLDARRSWRTVRTLPGVDAVRTAGSVRGLEHGLDALVARAAADPEIARLVLASGGLTPDQVPWLVRAGVRQVRVSTQVRPSGSWDKAYADAALVRSWRLLLDAEVEAARR
ncbi:copper homeostasis protein CutC [Nocardioidaceae bacterium]|nr:copper homeostasis protein CutC [Nocardioidaceae bacterium]